MVRRILILALLFSLPALAASDTVSQFFVAGRYEEARQALDQGNEGFRAGEATMWAAQLATKPTEALVLLREGLEDKRISPDGRIRLALEIANIEFGRGQYQSSFKALRPLLNDDQGQLPGAVYLRAGLSLRALGNPREAREMLASVKPQDPAFLLARFFLGDIALEMNDAPLALRYFESAAVQAPGGEARVAGGQWRAYRVEGRDQEAADLEVFLAENEPGCLALLEITRLRRMQQEELEAMGRDPQQEGTGSESQAPSGRYALQLGAFSDRGLALEFLRRYKDQVPGLLIEEVRDQRGQFLYKVRAGSFVNPAQAKTEARRLADQLDMEVIVADRSDLDSRSN